MVTTTAENCLGSECPFWSRVLRGAGAPARAGGRPRRGQPPPAARRPRAQAGRLRRDPAGRAGLRASTRRTSCRNSPRSSSAKASARGRWWNWRAMRSASARTSAARSRSCSSRRSSSSTRRARCARRWNGCRRAARAARALHEPPVRDALDDVADALQRLRADARAAARGIARLRCLPCTRTRFLGAAARWLAQRRTVRGRAIRRRRRRRSFGSRGRRHRRALVRTLAARLPPAAHAARRLRPAARAPRALARGVGVHVGDAGGRRRFRPHRARASASTIRARCCNPVRSTGTRRRCATCRRAARADVARLRRRA